MMIVFAVVAVVVAFCIIWFIAIYNAIVRLNNMKDEGWSGIDIQLKRRFDLVPNLVETVKAYSKHEKETFESITKARAMITLGGSIENRLKGENMLSSALKSLFAVTENYPELKANENFLQLQTELSRLEDEIQISRRYYNGTARNFNIGIQSFPAVLIAGKMRYAKAPFFEAEESEKKNVEVKLS